MEKRIMGINVFIKTKLMFVLIVLLVKNAKSEFFLLNTNRLKEKLQMIFYSCLCNSDLLLGIRFYTFRIQTTVLALKYATQYSQAIF